MTARPRPMGPLTLEQALVKLEFDTIAETLTTDSLMGHLEYRVAALEAIVATPWPLRILAAWRLGRALRQSVRHFPGDTFAERRTEAASNDWLGR